MAEQDGESGPGTETDAWTLIRTPVGGEWSGRTRYAAAMDLYRTGALTADTLEVYRICSRLDDEDPLDVLRKWKTGAEWIRRLEDLDNGAGVPSPGEQAVRGSR